MNQLFSGNALDVMQRDLGIFQAVITDPPYASGATLSEKQQGTSQKYTNTKHRCPFPDFVGDSMDQRSWMHMMRQVLEKARDKCVPGAALAIFIDWRNLPLLTDAVQWAGWSLRGVAVWDKLSSRPQRGRFRQQAEFVVWGSNGSMPVDRGVGCLPGVFRAANVQALSAFIKPRSRWMSCVRSCRYVCLAVEFWIRLPEVELRLQLRQKKALMQWVSRHT